MSGLNTIIANLYNFVNIFLCLSLSICYARHMRNTVRSFDARVTSYIQSWPAWWAQPMRAITDTGQPLTVILFAVGLLIWALFDRNAAIVQSSIVVLGTVVVSTILKTVLRRARPVNDYVASMIFKTFSFPSGHAAAATVGFGLLAYFSFVLLSMPLGFLVGIALILYILLIGVSRVYLGAHYPSDVLGGMILGCAGLAIILLVVRPLG